MLRLNSLSYPLDSDIFHQLSMSNLYLNDPDNHDGVITHTHLDPDILECEVKWALESITTNKASAGDGIPVQLFNPER